MDSQQRGAAGLRAALERAEAEIAELRRELEETNRGLIAVYAELEDAERKTEQILESTPDGIVLSDAGGGIVFTSRQAEALSGYSREELADMRIEDLVPEAMRGRHAEHRRAYHLSPVARPMGAGLRVRLRRKDGSELPVDVALSTLTTEEGILILAAVRDITERERIEAELEEARSTMAIVEDRERIGRELHDGAIQTLFGIGINLQGVTTVAQGAHVRSRLTDAVVEIDSVIRDLRNYIFGLRPGLAADRGLDQALRHLADDLDERHGIACATDVDPELAALLSPRAADMIMLVQEALANVARHASAATCRVTLRADEERRAILEIEDDGRGFSPETSRGKGWGLRNLEERAALLGGEMEIRSTPGEGSLLRFTIAIQ